MAKSKTPRKRAAKGPKRAAGVASFDHVYLPTADYGPAWTFWTEVVGLKAAERWGEGSHRAGVARPAEGAGLVVAQEEDGGEAELGYTIRLGRPQLFFRVKDIQGFYERVRARGARVCVELHRTHWGPMGFSLEAPDGLIVSFVE